MASPVKHTTAHCRHILAGLVLGTLTAMVPAATHAQAVIKTNLVYDATLTVNLGTEFRLAPQWTVDVSGNYNGWKLSDRRQWRHWLIQPEVRYWLSEYRHGHFLGAHLLGGQFNAGAWKARHGFLSNMHDRRYQGWAIGAGVAYGYSWRLGRHWDIEAEIGVGYIFRRYDTFLADRCGRKLSDDKSGNYFGPTKVAVNLVYVF